MPGDEPCPAASPRSASVAARWGGGAALGAFAAAPAIGLDSLAGVVLLVAGTVVLTWLACRRTASRNLLRVDDQRVQALASAADHAARWQAIVDTATEGIVTIDANGRIETVNGAAERLFGYGAAELIGADVSVLMPEPFRSEHGTYLQRYLATGDRRVIGIGREVLGRRKDGSEFPVYLSIGEGTTNDRRFFTAVLRDVSDHKDMQTKLAQAERLAAVGELAAGVAHEVNNPINTIINCAQLIVDGDDPARNCQIITEEGQRIADIVRDLLQFARDDRDRAQPTSLPEVVQRTLRLVGENWQRHGIAIEVDVPEGLPLLHARPQQIQQVLLNLLINAKDALLQTGRDGRRVWLCAHPARGGIEFSVRDNGPGIPPQLGPRIFEPFVTTKRARGGTGLGLSISRSIVEGYGGTIEVDSEQGQGATFRVWLPQAPAE